MPDLLAHALIAYTLGHVLSWRYDWLSSPYVTVVMAGAFIPDLMKIVLVVPGEMVEVATGFPFDWFALHTLGGCLISVGIGVVLAANKERRRVAALLTLGMSSHLIADAFLITPSGRAFPLFWPLTRYQPALPGLYLSTDPLPMIVTGVAGLAALIISRSRQAVRLRSR